MISREYEIKTKIRNKIIYSSIIFLVFEFWFFYSTYNNIIILYFISFSILILLICSIIFNFKIRVNKTIITFQSSLLIIPITFLIDIIFFYRPLSPPFFFSINNLIGLVHRIDIISFSILLALVLLKLAGVKIYFINNIEILEARGGDEIFQYFTKEIDFRKIIMFVLLFPLSAFIEELIYRSILLSFFIYYFNLNIFIGITIISLIFGFVHYSTSKNWGHVLSTLISSVIYFFALIQLGLLFAWIFHLITNLFVLLFYYQTRRKSNKKINNTI